MSKPSRRRAELIRRVEARKGASVGQLLFKAARLWNELAMARIQSRVPSAKMAHTTLLPHIDFDGTRQTEIARRAGITKQAVGQLVDELIAAGMLRRDPDPHDGRAQLVRFTDEGIEQLLVGLDVLDNVERELGDLSQLRRQLIKLIPALQTL